MPMDFKSKFDELFGQEEATSSAPTLRDVTPGLVDSGRSGYSSKELNPRRTAVSARSFRNPRVRSKEGAFDRQGAVESQAPTFSQPNQYVAPLAEDRSAEVYTQGGGPGPGGGLGASGIGASGSALGGGGDNGLGTGGALGEAMGNEAALSMGTTGLMSALGTVGLGAAVGAPIGAIGSAALGSGVTGALGMTGPMGLAGLANSIGGTIASGIMGSNAAEDVGLSPTGKGAAAAQGSLSSNFGLLGMAVNSGMHALSQTDIAQSLGMDTGLSPTSQAQEAAVMAETDPLTAHSMGFDTGITSSPAVSQQGTQQAADPAVAAVANQDNPENQGFMSNLSDLVSSLSTDSQSQSGYVTALDNQTPMHDTAASMDSAPDTGNFGGGLGTSGGSSGSGGTSGSMGNSGLGASSLGESGGLGGGGGGGGK